MPGRLKVQAVAKAINQWAGRTLAEVSKTFWRQVVKTDTCWLWAGTKPNGRYGAIEYKKKRILAHRFAWILVHGEIPLGMKVLHRCDIPECVNPFHLFLGTHQDNMDDSTTKGRRHRMVGKNHPTVKITEEQAVEIRRMSQTMKSAEIAKIIGAPYRVVLDVLSGKTWKHLILMNINDITKWQKTNYKCPACTRFLWEMQLDNGMGKVFWCGWGPCPSLTTNDGAKSVEELRKKYEEEPEYKESGDWP